VEGGDLDMTEAAELVMRVYMGEDGEGEKPSFLVNPRFESRVFSEHIIVAAGINSREVRRGGTVRRVLDSKKSLFIAKAWAGRTVQESPQFSDPSIRHRPQVLAP
jgi:hypothetical protein